MTHYAIEVKGLSKRYGTSSAGLSGLKGQLVQRLMRPNETSQSTVGGNAFWALKDVTFNVPHGQIVGIIGRNGAGKSTLLKVLSRITRPTAGTIRLRGRLGALLEVGTGFHPELSGRENILLNASILGLSRKQIADRFEQIVEFAEVGQFIDMPVKHYSSGMYMRLAFSVSAHLDPDILVLDEVLAVGDGAFQKKCLTRMDSVAKDGRTVLLVSHSLPMIVAFCNRAILLDQGSIERDGSAEDVVEYYQESLTVRSNKDFEVIHAEENKTGSALFTGVRLTPLDANGSPTEVLRVGCDLEIDLSLEAHGKITDANVAIVVRQMDGYRVIDANLALKDDYLSMAPGQKATVRFTLRNLLLKPDTYRLAIWIGRKNVEDIDINVDAATFTVELDPRSIQHFQIFPGVYQCAFTHTVGKT